MTEFGNCSTGDGRLGSPVDSPLLMSREGRVEVCINNAWGTVCDENEWFGADDATVFCRQLTGFSHHGEQCDSMLHPFDLNRLPPKIDFCGLEMW